MEALKIESFGKYTFKLSTGTKYPYSVLVTRDTPKAKYSKVKIVHHFGFPNMEKAIGYIQTQMDNLKVNFDRLEADRVAKRNHQSKLVASDHFKVDDIIVNTWGWEQTNVDFYVVEKVMNKKIFVRSIGQNIVEGSEMPHGMACDVTADPKSRGNKTYLLSLKTDASGRVWICNPESYYYFHMWDGRPQYKSWYA